MDLMSNAKVLLVEDDKSVQRAIELLLNEYQIIVADSVQQARSTLSDHPDIALVISDYDMPGGTGLDLLRWIRERSEARFLLISGSYRGKGNEDFAFLAKPFEASELRQMVSDLLSGNVNPDALF